jgi:hypothetical protein
MTNGNMELQANPKNPAPNTALKYDAPPNATIYNAEKMLKTN